MAPGRPPLTPWKRRRPKGSTFHRRYSPLTLPERIALHVERDAALLALATCDRRLQALTRERLAVLGELDELREALWPRLDFCRVARPPAHNQPPLPPAPVGAIALAGKDLRWTCLALLSIHGAQQLRDLHTLLHAHGYVIVHHHPVKALADAMGQEHDDGRAQRVRRGVYALADGFRPRRGRHGHPSRLDEDRRRRDATSSAPAAPPAAAPPPASPTAAPAVDDRRHTPTHDQPHDRPPDQPDDALTGRAPGPSPTPPRREPPRPSADAPAPNPWPEILAGARLTPIPGGPAEARAPTSVRTARDLGDPRGPTAHTCAVGDRSAPPHLDPDLRLDADQWREHLGFTEDGLPAWH